MLRQRYADEKNDRWRGAALQSDKYALPSQTLFQESSSEQETENSIPSRSYARPHIVETVCTTQEENFLPEHETFGLIFLS